jgi:hypothetical protein
MDLHYLFKFKHFSCWKFSQMHKYAKNNSFKCLNIFKNLPDLKNEPRFEKTYQMQKSFLKCARYFWPISPAFTTNRD